MDNILIIDLDKCRKNIDVLAGVGRGEFIDLIERLGFSAICRQCKAGACVQACPKEALERDNDGTVTRSQFRCVSCKCCAVACPFGVILPHLLPYISATYTDDFRQSLINCSGRLPEGAIVTVDSAPADSDLISINDRIKVRVAAWTR